MSSPTENMREAPCRRLTYISNLFPTPEREFFGTFVKMSSDGMENNGWDVKIIALPHYGTGIFSYVRFYAKSFIHCISSSDPVYVHYISHSAAPVIAAKLLNWKLPVYLHYHGSDAFPETEERPFRRAMKRAACSMANLIADAIIAPSDGFLKRISLKYNIRGKRVFVSPSGGVDLNTFPPGAAPSRDISLLFAGRMIKGKGGIEAAIVSEKVLTQTKDSIAVFVGTGPERADIERILSPFLNEDRVVFFDLLPQNELSLLYQRSQIFLFPSTRQGESLGLTWIEAAVSGAVPLVLRNGITENLLPAPFDRALSGVTPSHLAELALNYLARTDDLNDISMELSEALRKEYCSHTVANRLSKFFTDQSKY
ncbi:glycosyltransferase family 4 protein [Stenotrophomonas sp. DR009]|uniref:glycosyltransferase family 4 protein n=1 Tax=Stenotrophomonas sp. DR009 TaxID=3398461 RepID=UPI003BB10619